MPSKPETAINYSPEIPISRAIRKPTIDAQNMSHEAAKSLLEAILRAGPPVLNINPVVSSPPKPSVTQVVNPVVSSPPKPVVQVATCCHKNCPSSVTAKTPITPPMPKLLPASPPTKTPESTRHHKVFVVPKVPLAIRLRTLNDVDVFTRLFHDVMENLNSKSNVIKNVHLTYWYGSCQERESFYERTKMAFHELCGYLTNMGFSCMIAESFRHKHTSINVVAEPGFFVSSKVTGCTTSTWQYLRDNGKSESMASTKRYDYVRLLSTNVTSEKYLLSSAQFNKIVSITATPKSVTPPVTPVQKPQDEIPIIDLCV